MALNNDHQHVRRRIEPKDGPASSIAERARADAEEASAALALMAIIGVAIAIFAAGVHVVILSPRILEFIVDFVSDAPHWVLFILIYLVIFPFNRLVANLLAFAGLVAFLVRWL